MPNENQQQERLIFFSAPMVRAILDGTKTQTRRVINPQPWQERGRWFWRKGNHRAGNTTEDLLKEWLALRCPYGQPGDRLYCKESFCGPVLTSERGELFEKYYYKATHEHNPPRNHKAEVIPWKSGRFMPKSAARLWLEITGVIVERLQEISPDDCIADGIKMLGIGLNVDVAHLRVQYRQLWDSINGKARRVYYTDDDGKRRWRIQPAMPWASNPWVWVISFCRVDSTKSASASGTPKTVLSSPSQGSADFSVKRDGRKRSQP